MQRLRQAPGGMDDGPVRAGPVPAAPAQARLWLLQSLDPAGPTYNLAAALDCAGPLDPHVLRRAVEEIVRRHEPLRTAFPAADGVPVPQVAKPGPVDVPIVDLGAVSPRDRDGRARALAAECGRRPFDVEQGPLARFLLIRLAEDRHLLVVAAHHLVADGWSFGVFATEFAALYEAYAAGGPSPLPEPGAGHREAADGGTASPERLAYWTTVLGGDLPVLDLPADRPRPPRQTFTGRRHGFSVPPEVTETLRADAARHGPTLYTRLLGAFAVTLRQITGQSDLVIGTPVSGRAGVAAEGLIGFFVNTLAIRVDLSGTRTHADALRVTDRAVRGALAHQDIPFDQVIQALKPPRHPDRPIVRQAAFAFQPVPVRPLRAGALTLRPLDPDQVDLGVSPLDLSLHMWEAENGLRGCLEYNTGLFDEDTVAGWADTFLAVLGEAGRDTSNEPVESGLTEGQLLLHFGKELTPGIRLYYEYVTALFTIESDLDPERFRRAWQRLVDESDALRSTLHETGRVPHRKVAERMAAPLELADLSGEADPDAAARRWAAERARPGLDLTRRIFDAALLRLGPGRHAWYLSVHHSFTDAWSMAIILRRVSGHYAGRDPGPMRSFTGYVAHERRRRGSSAHRRAERYWRERLAAPLDRIPFYGRHGASPTTRTERISVGLGAERSRRIREAARREGYTTPAIVLATALFAYLRRVGGGDGPLRVGTPFANRPTVFRDTVGMFMNVRPLQVEPCPGDDFRGLAARVQRAFLEAARHQDHPIRNPATAPVYEVYFNYQNVGFAGFGSRVEAEILETGHSRDRLALQVRDFAGAGSYTLDFDFNVGCFGDEDRPRTVRHYLNLLDAFLDDPAREVPAAPMLDPGELRRLALANATERPYDLAVPLHARVERQVHRTPDADAVVFEDRRLTFAEVNAAANRLARRLREAGGLHSEALVGVFMERSPEMLVGLLAILKAGGCYLPLDPAHPPERTAFMLRDAGVGTVLTQARLKERLKDGLAELPPGDGGVRVVLADDASLTAEDAADLGVTVRPDDLAYAIYTSGSTGKPKCALLTHRGIVNRLLWMQEEYGLTAADRVLQKTPFTFDVSVWEFFWPLLTGATLVVARPEGHKDPAYLIETINRERVTVVHFVPSMLRVFLDTPDAASCVSLTRVICSGEALTPGLARHFLRLLPAELHNLYGPTEASVDVSAWPVPRDAPLDVVPIGRPIANTTLHVLDGDLRPLPIGVPGELHIGGVQLARGYLGRPDLTRERFVRDPASGRRLYRTGDLARYLPDGSLEYLGRRDGQVKLRGFRIELGEIETVLTAHPAVRAAAVALRNDRLVAYVVPDRDTAGTGSAGTDLSGDLAAHAARTLPGHMVPAAVVAVPELPMTPNGKLDRRALPEPAGTRASARHVAPRTPAEAQIAALWAEVLGRDGIGVHDDFFELGGHSLLAARLVAAAERRLGARLPLAAMFQAPTVAGLAALLDNGDTGSLLVPIRHGDDPPLFVVHPAGGDVMPYRELAMRLPAGRAVIGVRSRAQLGQQEHTTLADMAADYAAAVRERQQDGPYHLLGWSLGGTIAVSVAAELESRGGEVAFVGLLDPTIPAHEEDPLAAPAVALAGLAGDLHVDARAIATLRERLRGRPLTERLDALRGWAEHHGLLTAAAPGEVLLRQARLADVHARLTSGHHLPEIDTPIDLWWAAERAPRAQAGERVRSRGGVREDELPGGHFTMLRPPQVAEAAAQVAAALDRTHRERTSA